jgi:hypothetical protein
MKMLTVRGSWVSSQAEMQELTKILARRGVHPELTDMRCFGSSNPRHSPRRIHRTLLSASTHLSMSPHRC